MMTKGLVVVAHPDDETIWMAGKIMREKNVQWAVLSLCRKGDADRMPKFFEVCSLLGARGFISDLDDDYPEKKLASLEEVIMRVEPIVHDKYFEFVFTHGANGEYGHNRHIEVNKALHKMVSGKAMKCRHLFEFDYIRFGNPFHCEPNPKAGIRFELTPKEHEAKRKLITDAYGFHESSFEFMSCSAVESFRKVF